MTIYYAGVGSRETPAPIAAQMQTAAAILAVRGFTLRSGRGPRKHPYQPGVESADLAFEAGCDSVAGAKVIRTPTIWQPAMDHAAQFHPVWNTLDRDRQQQWLARTSLIMLGDTLNDPVRFVLCWTPNGAIVGGTGQALRIAGAYSIPVFNLAVTPIDALWQWIDSHGK